MAKRNRVSILISDSAPTGRTVELSSSGPVKISGMGVTVDAGTGVLELKGQQVKVTGQSTAELTASGSVTIRGGIVRIN